MLQHRKKRLQKFFIIMLLSAIGVSLVLFALNSKLDLFYSPSEMLAADIKPGYRIKLGGMVEIDSIKREGTKVLFVVTDFKAMALKSVTTKRTLVPSRLIESISTIPPSLIRYPGLISAASISDGE